MLLWLLMLGQEAYAENELRLGICLGTPVCGLFSPQIEFGTPYFTIGGSSNIIFSHDIFAHYNISGHSESLRSFGGLKARFNISPDFGLVGSETIISSHLDPYLGGEFHGDNVTFRLTGGVDFCVDCTALFTAPTFSLQILYNIGL